ncbi:NUDIX domain-containing protein [Saccharibacillus sp. CPCC 101409]|uniref:NUDIX hydrolase n=1 Tax=Saccharibacillus sp. CPCC 101409 TaxID=3058041 RepID=UPI002671FD61|nr:NUDIX domain-containing protein [Saccharibacillus sp. CPCC 101409]MDO3412300.1 NUDIX domain-containing protein [Saccharibacillus sp. CPCC 101409]
MKNKEPEVNVPAAVIDKVAWILVRNGKVLGARSRGKDTYYFPGGKREPGESDIQTLAREIEEELTVRVKPETAELFGAFEAHADGKAEGVSVRMTCYTAEYEGELSPAAEIEELAWLDESDLHRVSAVSRLVFDRIYGAESGSAAEK